ncbi:tail fiber domain-containing protein [bacterium SCSIO 12741]|nr:tail fiber domain-containing protein [bacterium SCSIO 12741]
MINLKTFLTGVLGLLATSGFAQWNINGNTVSPGDYIGTNNNEPFLFYTWDPGAGSAVERARIDNNGKLGVATTSPRSQVESVSGEFIGVTGEMNGGKIESTDYPDNERITSSGFGDPAAGMIGVYGRGIENHMDAEGTPIGVYGFSRTNTGERPSTIGVVGYSRGGSVFSIGVKGLTFPGADYNTNRMGVLGQSITNSGFGIQIGVRGDASGAAQNIGVHGESSTGPNDWAGHFIGRVLGTGGFHTVSDARLKNNYSELTNMSELLMALTPMQYDYRTDEYPNLHLKEGRQYGFIAQDLQEVFPEMVTTTKILTSDNHSDKVTPSEEEFLTVDYLSMVPVLVKAFQEQQKEIEELKTEIAQKTSEIEALQDASKSTDESQLLQISSPNTQSEVLVYPNPANDYLVIEWEENEVSKVVLHTLSGKILMTETVSGLQHELNTSSLSNGVYAISLFAKDQSAGTQMIMIQH